MLQLRASQIHKIVTNKPYFDESVLQGLEQQIQIKVSDYSRDNLHFLAQTKGVMTLAKDIMKQLENQRLVEFDPLPEGAKTYLEELWLEEQGFYSFATTENMPQFIKGKTLEEEAIRMIANVTGVWDITKNEERITKGCITGECDIKYDSTIRDCKIPTGWESYRKKDGIPSQYRWQLVAYMYLYEKTTAFIDYVLLSTPPELIQLETNKLSSEELGRYYQTQTTIDSLPLNKRVKTFQYVDNLEEDINFMLKRAQKCEEYYSNLTLEMCLKL